MLNAFRFLAGLAVWLLAASCSAAALLGLGGGVSDWLDLFNQFTPFWLAGGLAAFILAFPSLHGAWRRMALAAAAVAVLIGGVRVAPEVLARFAPEAPVSGERLKLVQFNTYMANTDPEGSIDWILAQDADVVVILEGEGLTRDRAQRLRALYPYCNGCNVHGLWSNLILAKRPAIAQGRFERPDPDTNFPMLGGWSRFEGPGGAFTVVGAHLTWPWRRFGPPQREALAEFVSRGPTERMILSGDFNMTPWSTALRRFDRSVGDMTRRTHGEASWPAQTYYRFSKLPVSPVPLLAIDQVYAGPGWRTVSVKRGPRLGSDHYPIVVELAAEPKRP